MIVREIAELKWMDDCQREIAELKLMDDCQGNCRVMPSKLHDPPTHNGWCERTQTILEMTAIKCPRK